ncbi:hypothetical protein DAEQUDRAFT_660021 [Daedalea quercina L-15889]|uniref:Uncharacterized protein n=1 Tax=Daedalea quercina L-15889 TaxID=1314783 RepID=A0A165UK65_9APHY|nr:hypothetical protein DAEQUDRAFT_660021 [Daedalea quercina L-15889]
MDIHIRSESSEPLLYDSPSSPRTPKSPIFVFPKPKPFLVNAPLRRLLVLVAAFSSITILVFASISLLSSRSLATESVATSAAPQSQLTVPHSDVAVNDNATTPYYSPYILGPPTESFRDNLRDDVQYITSWISAGWTNDVMTYMNLIYLGVITSRVPIIGMFTPSHVIGADNVPFGDVFDVPRFIEESGIEILEWRDVKDPQSDVLDDIGCWNIWEVTNIQEKEPRGSWVPIHVRLDISYTRAPEWVKLIPNYIHSRSASFWQLARLAFPEELRNDDLPEALPSPQHQVQLPPDEHVVCYDYLYYVVAQRDDEFEHDFAPAWRFVGQYMHWTPELQELTNAYVRLAFGLEDDAEVPPYIAIHQRHGDFRNWCPDKDNTEDCFAPISVIQRRVREVQDELRLRKDIDIPDTHVIITSDEQDQAWWDEVTSLGWVKIDHDAWETERKYGKWYPVFLDAAIHSSATGFVGTHLSTYSTVSRRRVEDWQDGATRIVKWGHKGADDH